MKNLYRFITSTLLFIKELRDMGPILPDLFSYFPTNRKDYLMVIPEGSDSAMLIKCYSPISPGSYWDGNEVLRV